MWWNDLLAALAKPGWTAGTVQAFVGAALAFGGALLLIRIQLRSDRRLVDTQIRAMADDRTAERRSNAADHLGRSLIEASRAMDGFTTAAYLSAVRDMKVAPGATAVYDAEGDARLILDLDQSVLDLWRLHTHLWDALRVNVGKHDAEPRGVKSEWALEAACESLLNPLQGALATLGRALVRWDGTGAIPSKSVIESIGWEVPLTGATAYKEWQASVATQFESLRAAFYARND